MIPARLAAALSRAAPFVLLAAACVPARWAEADYARFGPEAAYADAAGALALLAFAVGLSRRTWRKCFVEAMGAAFLLALAAYPVLGLTAPWRGVHPKVGPDPLSTANSGLIVGMMAGFAIAYALDPALRADFLGAKRGPATDSAKPQPQPETGGSS